MKEASVRQTNEEGFSYIALISYGLCHLKSRILILYNSAPEVSKWFEFTKKHNEHHWSHLYHFLQVSTLREFKHPIRHRITLNHVLTKQYLHFKCWKFKKGHEYTQWCYIIFPYAIGHLCDTKSTHNHVMV